MRHKVLVIDDDEGFTLILKMNLERSGEFEVRVENNSLVALSAACEFEPDVVLLDLVMPGLDGADVAAHFERHPALRKIPIIVLTGVIPSVELAPDVALQAGWMNVLPKPVDMATLTRRIHDALRLGDPIGV